MCIENARRLQIYPMECFVKVDDTLPGIEEGLNAGMWTVGLAKSGNEIGLNLDEIAALDTGDYERRLSKAYTRLYQTGAHYVVDSIADLLPCIDDIADRVAAGDQP